MELTPILAFLFGITTAVSICTIYVFSSIAAFSLSTSKFDKIRPALIALGNFSAIVLIGLFVLNIGIVIEDYLIYLQIPAALFVLITGIYLIFVKVKNTCSSGVCDDKGNSTINKLKTRNLFYSFLFGFSIGLLCLTCIFPIFGAIMAITLFDSYIATLLIFSYAFGHTLPILLFAYIPYFSKKFTKEKIEKNIVKIRKVSGIVLIIIAFFLFLNLLTCSPDNQEKYIDNQY